MQTLSPDLNKKYTFADYLTWADNKRRELIDGFVKIMTPAPKRAHQQVASNLHGLLWNYLRKKPCEIYNAPFDVRFLKNGQADPKAIDTVVQPDISIICDPAKLDEYGCLGAPDMIIEIVSPGNSNRDVSDKFALYQRHGVREYWIVHPNDQTVNVFILKEGQFILEGMYGYGSTVKVNIWDGFEIDLTDVFDKQG